jgi:hypothetical protein
MLPLHGHDDARRHGRRAQGTCRFPVFLDFFCPSGGGGALCRVVGSSSLSSDEDRGRWILSRRARRRRCQRDNVDHGRWRGVDDPRRHTGGGDAGPFDSVTLPHLVDEPLPFLVDCSVLNVSTAVTVAAATAAAAAAVVVVAAPTAITVAVVIAAITADAAGNAVGGGGGAELMGLALSCA